MSSLDTVQVACRHKADVPGPWV